jgi:hypothetical protein
MGAVIRSALARAGVDAAGATRLCFAEQAATPPAAIPVMAIRDTAELQREEANGAPLANADDNPWVDHLESKILALVRRFAGAPARFCQFVLRRIVRLVARRMSARARSVC